MSIPILKVNRLVKRYPVRGGIFSRKQAVVRAVESVSFDLAPGQTLGLVGESGCGKSTLGRTILHLEAPTEGEVFFDGQSLSGCSHAELFAMRRAMQMIFQDPYSSLNPRLTVGEIIVEPMEIHRLGKRADRVERVRSLLSQVGLEAQVMERYPHEFSGGQRQRIGIARSLSLNPKLIIADEPLSALDVSVQAQVINLMVSLQRSHDLTYIFISHDLSVVEYMSDVVAVMYLGRIVEIGPTRSVFERAAHPYTRALLESVPVPDPGRRRDAAPVQGETPSALNPPAGCAFHPRCPFAVDACREAVPALEPVASQGDSSPDGAHRSACIRQDELPRFTSPLQ